MIGPCGRKLFKTAQKTMSQHGSTLHSDVILVMLLPYTELEPKSTFVQQYDVCMRLLVI